MEYRQLGCAGVRVSAIGLGTNRVGSPALPQTEVPRILDAALDLGINFLDTSNTYGHGRAEETLGHALKGRWAHCVVATKFVLPVGSGPNDRGASRYHMLQALEASLRRLQSDHIDLYSVHRWAPTPPLDETLRALDDLVRMGKVHYIGVSDFAAWQLARVHTLAALRDWPPVVAIQSEYHLLHRAVEREVLPSYQAYQVGFVPYYPLAGGFLTGKYRRGEPLPPGSRGATNRRVQHDMTPANYTLLERLTPWAADHGRGLNELAQAWLLAHAPVCSVITGATTLDHVLSNVKAASWTLIPAQVVEVNTMLTPHQS